MLFAQMYLVGAMGALGLPHGLTPLLKQGMRQDFHLLQFGI